MSSIISKSDNEIYYNYELLQKSMTPSNMLRQTMFTCTAPSTPSIFSVKFC